MPTIFGTSLEPVSEGAISKRLEVHVGNKGCTIVCYNADGSESNITLPNLRAIDDLRHMLISAYVVITSDAQVR
jgi:hypothetical protein